MPTKKELEQTLKDMNDAYIKLSGEYFALQMKYNQLREGILRLR